MSDSSVATTPKDVPGHEGVQRGRQPLGRLGRGILLRFVLFAGLTLVVMLLVMVYAIWRQFDDARGQQQVMVRWTANTLTEWFRGMESQLASAAQGSDALDGSVVEMDTYLNNVLLRSPAFSSATLLDTRAAQPRELKTVARGGISAMPYISEWLTPTLQQGNYIAPMHFVQGMPMVVLSHTINKAGRTIGIVAVQADLSQTYYALGLARTDRGAYAYVVDGVGRTVLHQYSPFMFSRELHPEVAGIRAALEERALPLAYQGLNPPGERVIGAYASLKPLLPWTVIAEQPLAPLVGQALPIVYGAAGILLLAGAAAAVVGFYISRRVANPIAQLQEGARRIGAGNLDYRIDLGKHSELGDLAAEFNGMAGNLRESLAHQEAWSHELEERVKARTAELSETLEQLQEESRARENLLLLVKEMSSPVIPVMAGIIVIPIVGALDSERAQRVMDDLLAGVERERARVVILDITGLAMVDTAVANALLQASRAAQLLGAQPILVGIAPEVAETLVHLGVEIQHLRTAATLQEGLRLGLAMLHRKVVAL